MLDGIRNKIEPPSPVESNIYHLSERERKRHKIDSLPGSLAEAIYLLERSHVAKDALGEHIFSEFVYTGRRRYHRYIMLENLIDVVQVQNAIEVMKGSKS